MFLNGKLIKDEGEIINMIKSNDSHLLSCITIIYLAENVTISLVKCLRAGSIMKQRQNGNSVTSVSVIITMEEIMSTFNVKFVLNDEGYLKNPLKPTLQLFYSASLRHLNHEVTILLCCILLWHFFACYWRTKFYS